MLLIRQKKIDLSRASGISQNVPPPTTHGWQNLQGSRPWGLLTAEIYRRWTRDAASPSPACKDWEGNSFCFHFLGKRSPGGQFGTFKHWRWLTVPSPLKMLREVEASPLPTPTVAVPGLCANDMEVYTRRAHTISVCKPQGQSTPEGQT